MKIQENISLAPFTTLQVGGKARFFVEAQTENEVIEAVNFAHDNNLPLFILGGGSNLVVSDEGFSGLVLRIGLKGIEFFGENFVTAKAGEDWDNFVKLCVERDLQGIECLSGIPGTIGGTPVQNVGAYGQEVSETITNVKVLSRENGEILNFSNADCLFSYRSSLFNTTHKNKFIILSVTFRLKKAGKPKITYRDLQNFFGDKTPDLQETREAVRQIRAAKSMVIDENDVNSRSAGSFFKNPIVSTEKFAEVETKARELSLIVENQKVPQFPADENSIKIPAAWLIEKSGFPKGFVLGNAGISANHTLAIINRGNASAREIIDLARKIKRGVNEIFGIKLKPEPIFLGFAEEI